MRAFTTVQGEVMLFLSHEEAEGVASVAAHARRYYDRQSKGYFTLERVYDAISLPSMKLQPRGSEELFSALEAIQKRPLRFYDSENVEARRIKWEAW